MAPDESAPPPVHPSGRAKPPLHLPAHTHAAASVVSIRSVRSRSDPDPAGMCSQAGLDEVSSALDQRSTDTGRAMESKASAHEVADALQQMESKLAAETERLRCITGEGQGTHDRGAGRRGYLVAGSFASGGWMGGWGAWVRWGG